MSAALWLSLILLGGCHHAQPREQAVEARTVPEVVSQPAADMQSEQPEPISAGLAKVVNGRFREAFRNAEARAIAKPVDARTLTVLSPVTGRATRTGELWDVTLDLDGGRIAFQAEPPTGCVSLELLHLDEDEEHIAERRREARSVRVELGVVDGVEAWLWLDGSDVALIADGTLCQRRRTVTDLLNAGANPYTEESVEVRQEWKDGAWMSEDRVVKDLVRLGSTSSGDTYGDVLVHEIPGGFRLTESSGASVLQHVAPAVTEHGCLEGFLYLEIEGGRVAAARWVREFHFDCDPDSRRSPLRADLKWLRRANSKFSAPTKVSGSGPLRWVGTELEWRRTTTKHRSEQRVEWKKGAACGHEVSDSLEAARWEVRPKDGKWTVIGETLSTHYSKTICMERAGEP